jgi:hypothetical protein
VTGQLEVAASTRPRSDNMSMHAWTQARREAAVATRSRGGNTHAVCPVAAGGDEVDECRCRGRTHGAMEGASAPCLPGYARAWGQRYAGA